MRLLLAHTRTYDDDLARRGRDGDRPRRSGRVHWWRSRALKYDGHAYILIDLERVEPEHLRELLGDAWWLTAAAKMREPREHAAR
ncbi:hypothetical protein [Nocardia beijingensis]|uniref:hypothetical protein n=1 Tax=Nocardia beijingensis TaxID=95162 RepID=UPI001E354409|nr:hypothetical protein [Nocardia beijingensis]